MRKIAVWIVCLSILVLNVCYAEQNDQEDHLQPEDIRIFQLLPLMSHPPLVHPFLPSGFILGVREDDATFSKGYYWGYPANLKEYFSDTAELKGCIIWAKGSNEITQVNFDRFSDDQDIVHRLTAKGLTEIKITRGKWGIFPFRGMQAKGPKGKYLYQLWVGLNTEDGEVLEFQLLYPHYLNELTQNQKQLWRNFIQKTKLLELPYLLVAQKISENLHDCKSSKPDKPFYIEVKQRKSDRAFLIWVEGLAFCDDELEILDIKQETLLNNLFCSCPYVNIEYRMHLEDGSLIDDTLCVGYDLVDDFSFTPKMLSVDYMKEHYWFANSFDVLYSFRFKRTQEN
ncbi:MAG: hypothetical protein AAF443_07535 [Chlamydiota bacterium]